MSQAIKVYEYQRTFVTKSGETREYTHRISKTVTNSRVGCKSQPRYTKEEIATLKDIYGRLGNISATCRFCKVDGLEISPYLFNKLLVSDLWINS